MKKYYINRRKRKLQYIQLKNKMKGELFYSHDIIGDNTQWADIYFLGKNKTFYNATAMTTLCAWHDLIERKAWEELRRLTPNESYFEFEDGYISNPPLKGIDGKTASDFLQEQEELIGKSGTIEVGETFEILKGFKYGIGLNMFIHTPCLNKQAINHAILKFKEIGEQDWVSKKLHKFEYKKDINFSTNSISLD